MARVTIVDQKWKSRDDFTPCLTPVASNQSATETWGLVVKFLSIVTTDSAEKPGSYPEQNPETTARLAAEVGGGSRLRDLVSSMSLAINRYCFFDPKETHGEKSLITNNTSAFARSVTSVILVLQPDL